MVHWFVEKNKEGKKTGINKSRTGKRLTRVSYRKDKDGKNEPG